jgi:thiol-disulfide isomerase/thioredoxin
MDRSPAFNRRSREIHFTNCGTDFDSHRMSRLIVSLLLVFATAVSAGPGPRLDEPVKISLAALDRLAGAPLPDLDGKVVVVAFWASWCPPCLVEFRDLARLHKAFAERGLVIVAVNRFEEWNADENPHRMKRFFARTQPPFSVVGGDGSIARAFGGVERIPTVFVFDRSGDPIFSFVHLRGATKQSVGLEELEAAVRGHL